jgi:hypothetical protein
VSWDGKVPGNETQLCAVLGYISLDLGCIKITFESLPVLVAAMLFGSADGMLVGGLRRKSERKNVPDATNGGVRHDPVYVDPKKRARI